jgi:dTDP-4-amino-4,6-dideoxygalactose transaminase
LRYLASCLETNFVSSVGPFVPEFEAAMASTVGAAYGVACASGTAALHLALLACGVSAGDEVWVADLTFIASANPVRYCGGDVVLLDSERSTWNLDPWVALDEIERRAASGERQPRVIVAVHILGHPADLGTLRDRCAAYGITLVEDAAEALGARWTSGRLAGKWAGTAGRAGILSFNGNKLITTGGGGMLITDDAEVAATARHLATQARLPGLAYRHDEVGFNYRMSNLAAALGVAQLERLDEILVRKREIAARYDRAFEADPRVEVPPDAPWAARSAWLYTVLLEDPALRDALAQALVARGIEARPIWTPLRSQEPYVDCAVLGGDVAIDLAGRGLSLPCSVDLDDADQDEVIAAVLEIVRGA